MSYLGIVPWDFVPKARVHPLLHPTLHILLLAVVLANGNMAGRTTESGILMKGNDAGGTD